MTDTLPDPNVPGETIPDWTNQKSFVVVEAMLKLHGRAKGAALSLVPSVITSLSQGTQLGGSLAGAVLLTPSCAKPVMGPTWLSAGTSSGLKSSRPSLTVGALIAKLSLGVHSQG